METHEKIETLGNPFLGFFPFREKPIFPFSIFPFSHFSRFPFFALFNVSIFRHFPMFPFFHVLRFFTFELTSSTRSHLFSMPLSNSLRLHVRIQFRSHSDVTVQLTSSLRSTSFRVHFRLHVDFTVAFTSD